MALGIDLVSVPEVRDSIERFGSRYLERVYTPDELADARASRAGAASRLAARFAAKEAVLKALRPGDEPVPWTDIETRGKPTGACTVVLSGRALELSNRAGITRFQVSLTHRGGVAAAVAAALAAHSGEA